MLVQYLQQYLKVFSTIELIGLQELVAKRDLRSLDIAEKHFNKSRKIDYKIHEGKESFNFIPKKLNGPLAANQHDLQSIILVKIAQHLRNILLLEDTFLN